MWKFTPDGRRTTTDRRTDDGRCAMTIAHSSLRLGWAKNFRGKLFENGKRYAKSATTIQKALKERIPNHILHVKFERKTSVSQSKDYFGLKWILSYYVPVQTIVSPYDANCVTPLIYPTTDLDFLFGIIISFDLSFYFLFFWNLHTTFL